MRWLALLVALSACSEDEEGPYLDSLQPFPCEDNLDSQPVFTIPHSFDRTTLNAVKANPPVFELTGPDGIEPITVEFVDSIGLQIIASSVLLPDRDFVLDLVDRAGLGPNTEVPAMFPARFSTRNLARIRVVVARAGRVTISFSQPLDSDSVPANVMIPGSTRAAQYFDTDFHQVYFETADTDQPITVTFGPGLRTAGGLLIAPEPITIVPRDTTFVAAGCFYE